MSFSDIRSRIFEYYGISKDQLESVIQKSKDRIQKFRERNEKPVKQQCQDIDTFLFNHEDLPNFGKEYWFMLFSGLGGSYTDQLMLAYGRNKKNNMAMDGVNQLQNGDDFMGGVSEAWYYKDGSYYSLGTQGCKIFADGDSSKIIGDKYSISLQGKYPKYQIEVHQENQLVISLDIEPPVHGREFEFNQYFVGSMGYDLGNLYFKFTGNLAGKQFSGNSYVQKVIVTAPFVPWYWARIIFEDGSWFVLFYVWLEFYGVKKQVYTGSRFYDAQVDAEYEIKEFEFSNVEGTDYWIYTHHSEHYNLFLLLESYVSRTFEFKSTGKFNYTEMFAIAKEVRVQAGDQLLTLADIGHGNGSIESTDGIAF